MCSRASELPLSHDEVLVADWSTFEPAFENLPHACGIARLCGKRRAGNMRRHPFVRHGPPRMVARRRLRKPDIASVASKLSALERTNYCIAVADLAASRVHDVGAAFHIGDQCVVEQILR